MKTFFILVSLAVLSVAAPTQRSVQAREDSEAVDAVWRPSTWGARAGDAEASEVDAIWRPSTWGARGGGSRSRQADRALALPRFSPHDLLLCLLTLTTTKSSRSSRPYTDEEPGASPQMEVALGGARNFKGLPTDPMTGEREWSNGTFSCLADPLTFVAAWFTP
ncbi:hypothetical protein MKEN_00485700 [Mycena kentingensis (nom. inval.)]|nr:hypothetical protein MKEN_00485700 [Mycena kentingensis (nom. inval.)]